MNTTSTKPLPGHIERDSVYGSSVGRKIFMAISGFLVFGFVIGHMIGNLQIFLGQDQINTYAQALKDMPALIWTARIGVLLFFGIHVFTGVNLWLRNRSSRPVSYVREETLQATMASRTMIWSGIGVFGYVVYHLMHFTFIVTNPQYSSLHDSLGRHDVYSMIVLGFQNPIISAVYIISMFFIALHLSHGISSMFQSFGWSNTTWQPRLKAFAYLISTIIFLGYCSIPVAVLIGIIGLPGGGH